MRCNRRPDKHRGVRPVLRFLHLTPHKFSVSSSSFQNVYSYPQFTNCKIDFQFSMDLLGTNCSQPSTVRLRKTRMRPQYGIQSQQVVPIAHAYIHVLFDFKMAALSRTGHLSSFCRKCIGIPSRVWLQSPQVYFGLFVN